MSNQLNRKNLMVNQRRNIKQHFNYTPDFTPKSQAEPSVMSWSERGRGGKGESYNSSSSNDKFIVNKNWKPL